MLIKKPPVWSSVRTGYPGQESRSCYHINYFGKIGIFRKYPVFVKICDHIFSCYFSFVLYHWPDFGTKSLPFKCRSWVGIHCPASNKGCLLSHRAYSALYMTTDKLYEQPPLTLIWPHDFRNWGRDIWGVILLSCWGSNPNSREPLKSKF